MRLLETSAAVIIAMALTACATPQANPYYTHNTIHNTDDVTYQDSGVNHTAAMTQSASYQAPISYRAPTQPVFNHDPQPQQAGHDAPSAYAQPVYTQPAPSPHYATEPAAQTWQATSASQPAYQPSTTTMIETGGQNGGIGGQNLYADNSVESASNIGPTTSVYTQAPITAEQPATSYQASTPLRYDATVSGFATPVAAQGASSQMDIGYIVQEDDTVYSLSRRTCSTVSTIAQMNSLPPNFLIKAGQTLTLPASQC